MATEKKYYADANGVPMADGRVTHLGLAEGELAPRIVTVGSLSRARRLRAQLDTSSDVFELTSDRGFTTYTGTFGGVRVSIVATGMGAPMMDFLVREARTVVQGPLLFVRYGSCGGLRSDALPGTVVANSPGSLYVQRNYDAFGRPESEASVADSYLVSKPALPDGSLATHVRHALAAALGEKLLVGLNVSADSFYGSQGRLDGHFDDRNDTLVDSIIEAHRDVASMEMESFQLLHLAACSKPRGAIRAATAAIVCANRASGDVITSEGLHHLEDSGGKAVLIAITGCPLEPDPVSVGASLKRARE